LYNIVLKYWFKWYGRGKKERQAETVRMNSIAAERRTRKARLRGYGRSSIAIEAGAAQDGSRTTFEDTPATAS
jgi:hypothetical protein